jgi:hypothetical protein
MIDAARIAGLIAAATCAAVAGIAGRWVEAVPAATAVVLLLAWITLYRTVSEPINRQLAAAAASRFHSTW